VSAEEGRSGHWRETEASAAAPHECLSSLWLPERHIVELLSPEATSHITLGLNVCVCRVWFHFCAQ